MALLPLFLDVSGAVAVVTGTGPAALDAAARLAAAGARVRLVAATLAEVPGQLSGVAIDLVGEAPSAAHLDGARLLVAGAAQAGDDEAVIAEARRRGLPVVRAGTGAGDAFLGEAVERDGVGVAVTTRGGSPELESRLARQAAGALPAEAGALAAILAGLRERLEARYPDQERRAAIWQDILDSPVAALLQAGQDDEALELAERMAWGTG